MLQLKIDSMTCSHCTSMVAKAILKLQTDAKVEADLITKLVKIDSKLSDEEILDALDEVGYPATITDSNCSIGDELS